MKRQLIRGAPAPSAGPPQTSATAFRAAAITLAWNSSKRSQVTAVSNVSESTPQATKVSRRYGASRKAPRHWPTASLPSPPPPRTSPGLPPCSRAISTAASIQVSTGPCADSKPRIKRSASPLPAPVSSASEASNKRQLAGRRPDCESSRTAPAAAWKSSNSTPQESLNSGRGRTRTQASAIAPRIPSEPANIRSGEGPAPEPGSRRLSQIPRGVIARTDSTRSSMWVSTVAK